MSKNLRLHEVSKALGVTSKSLMTELAAAGFEFKTHMAVLDEAALAVIRKKHAQLEESLSEWPRRRAQKQRVHRPATTTSPR
jgi:hypothetical protein